LKDWFRYVVYSDPAWEPATFTPDRDAAASRDSNPFNIQTFPSQLDAFRAAGSKIITYHGGQDQQITSFITSKWYDDLLAGGRGATDWDQFIRFFPISGMDHCAGGPGAWMIGQNAGMVPFDASHNVLAAIVEWVEHGNSPDTIEGTKYIRDSATSGISFTRRHCR
jgi:feruloyl esterase